MGFQPDIVPSSVSKMKMLGPDLPCRDTTKPLVLLKTTPVGAAVVPAGLPGGGGIVTTSGEPSGNRLPFPLYRVDTPVPLSATHHGLEGVETSPQELTR